MAQRNGGEHRVQIPAPGAGQGKVAAPEKQLNCFVRSVALIERVGNVLGTLAFTWATVVLLGGYPTVLRLQDDFWFATIFVFLEAARMFSNNNRLDYQLFFHTRGALRPLGWNGLIIIVCLSDVLNYLLVISCKKYSYASPVFTYLMIGMLILTAVLGQFLSPGSLKLLANKRLRRATSLCSPLVAILLLAPSMRVRYLYGGYSMVEVTFRNTMVKWVVFPLLFLVVLLLTISRLHFRRIIKLVDRTLGGKQVFWHRLILNLCMFAALVIMAFMHDDPIYQRFIMAYQVYAVVVVSCGNFQIPAAVIRVMLALQRLITHDYYGDDPNNPANRNLAPSLNIFYVMVLGQGILYVVACLLEIFSFIPRRSLVRRGGFGGQWALESINLYYAYALGKCMERDVLAPKKISLSSFAMDSLNSDSPKMQLHGIRIMHSLLQREPTRLLPKLTASTKTIVRLTNMLEWTSPRDIVIRLFAAKVIAVLAKSLRVVTVPGIVQVVSALLDYGHQQKTGNPLFDTNGEKEETQDSIPSATDNQDERHDTVAGTNNIIMEIQDTSTQQVGIAERKFWVLTCWQRISEFWSVPKEEPLTVHDLLPAMGMSILENLACCDQDNCVEICKACGLIPKIIGFTSYCRSDTTYTDTQRKVLVKSSLKFLHRITSVEGEIGITLRHNISKHPFLLRNLGEILGDSTSGQDLSKLVAGILRNLATDKNTRHAIGHIRVIITRLMHAFLSPNRPSNTIDDRLLQKVAGQALAMLAIDNVNNCLAMLRETGHVFIKELTGMIHVDRYRCMAASLLRNICLHARPELEESDLKEISYILQEVLERIMDAQGAEQEIFIGLSSQICKVVPENFARELQHSHMEKKFVSSLINTLNVNMEPCAHCPGIRRVILEQAINMMEQDSHYRNHFNDCHMAEALSMVEETALEAENYIIFLGDVGLMEVGEPLISLVARSKQLLAVH